MVFSSFLDLAPSYVALLQNHATATLTANAMQTEGALLSSVQQIQNRLCKLTSDSLEQKDLNEAGRFLEENLAATPAGLPMAMNECAYKRHNTTIMSICNGSARNRTITQGEVKRGIAQLFKDCNKLGTFTGVHVVNNLTFAAYGIFAGINIKPPGGKNPPDTPGSVRKRGRGSWLEFVGDSPLGARADETATDCPVSFFGKSRTDCPRPEGITLNEDGSCGPIRPNMNSCQTFCEQKRTGLLGPETRAPGEAGESQPPGQALALTKGKETSISQGFSAGLEGVVKEVFGAGVTYECQSAFLPYRIMMRASY